jgi:hypothetical protein
MGKKHISLILGCTLDLVIGFSGKKMLSAARCTLDFVLILQRLDHF